MAKESRSDAIYASLRRAVLEQVLKPGTKLTEESLGEAFGVSRTAVRKALIQLGAEGLVEMRPNRGASIMSPALEEVGDVFELRRAAEGVVIARLCARMSKDAIDALESRLREQERASQAGGARSIRLAGEFHILLAELTNSRTLTDMVTQLVSRSSLILAQYGRPHSAEDDIEEHRQIIEALKEQDIEKARSLMDAHLESVETHAAENPESNEPDVASILRRYVEAQS